MSNSPQRGFAMAWSDGVLIAILYKTVVVKYNKDKRRLKLCTGGFATNSTTKAMNTAFEHADLFMLKAFVKDGVVNIAEGIKTHKLPFGILTIDFRRDDSYKHEKGVDDARNETTRNFSAKARKCGAKGE